VLRPLALAILFTFLLAPAVDAARRLGIGRVLSVCLVVVLALILLAGTGWVIGLQVNGLAHQLPQYVGNLKQKVADLRALSRGGALEKLQETAKKVTDEIKKNDEAGKPDEEKPVPVVVEDPKPVPLDLPVSPGTLLEALASAGFVVVLVFFMLLERAELRNRVIRLVGQGRLTVTTKALDEAGRRITRYLLTQAIVNGSFGVAIGLGLFLIGLPYPMVWGLLAAVIRYVPYVGPWIAALLPIALSLAVFDGWAHPLLVVGLFLVVELVSNNLMEPWLYGHTAGVSVAALLVAVAFWTWLWGPVGLILATPLTVCLVVLSKHVPEMEFIAVLMADEPGLQAEARYYQRLLAGDQDEAGEVVERFLQDHEADTVYDEILVPALVTATRDAAQGLVAADEQRFVLRATRQIIDDLPVGTADGESEGPAGVVVGCPARDEMDRLALVMFRRLLGSRQPEIEILSAGMLVAEIVAAVEEKAAAVACVAALPTDGLARTRHLCQRLRRQCPGLKILVGRWGPTDEQENDTRAALLAAGADEVGTTLIESRSQLLRTMQFVSPSRPVAPPPAPRVVVGVG
jgi:predicted PurR-regulated permease PerM